MTDRPRLLASRSELGYTESTQRALDQEPEAVSADEQAKQTRRGHAGDDARRKTEWHLIRRRLELELEELRQRFGVEVADECRALRRTIDRLERKLT